MNLKIHPAPRMKNKKNNEADTSSINQYSTIDVNRAMQIYTS